jgi:hypothetical protein
MTGLGGKWQPARRCRLAGLRGGQGLGGQRFEQHRGLAFVGAGVRTSSRPAAASNQRPRLVVGGQRRLRSSICATACSGRAGKAPSICSPRPAACNAAAAMRQGSRAPRRRPAWRWAPDGRCADSSGAVHPQQLTAPGRAVRCPGPRRPAPDPARGPCVRVRPPRRPRGRGGAARPQRQALLLPPTARKAGAEEVRVQVVRHRLRLHVQHATQVLHHLGHCVAGGGVVQAADVRDRKGLVTACDAHRVLQPGAGGQHAGAAAAPGGWRWACSRARGG